jgi:NADPH:quinone reductase-like Zn-dependent oxidoreductase
MTRRIPTGRRGRADYRRRRRRSRNEIGGAGTLAQSYRALGFGGKVALIGFLAGPGDPNPMPLMMKGASLHGIGVGSTRIFEDMNRAIEVNRIQPLVDKVFSLITPQQPSAASPLAILSGKS